MKARIEKKLSKRLATECPVLFKGAWQEGHEEPTELAEKQGTRVSGLMIIGGGVDYWGEGMDVYSCWEYWVSNWYWSADLPVYPEGSVHAGLPDTSGVKITTRNLLNFARQQETQLIEG